MGARTGSAYLNGLRDRREVWLGGKEVEDVTRHPALTNAASQLASLYDLQRAPECEAVLTYKPNGTGEAAGRAFQCPRSAEELALRGHAFRTWAEQTCGLMGRTPDFLNTVLMGQANARSFFARQCQEFADNIWRYYEHVRDNDLFLTHALLSPQTDRSKSSSEQAEEFLHLGVVRETSEGLIVRGARMMATLAPLADEVIIYTLPGLRPGDEKHALAFALPIGTPGLRLICRESFHNADESSFDHPLSIHFDEMDAMLVFDDVLVPWERVFHYGDVAHSNRLVSETRFQDFSSHQTAVRGVVKLKFAVGVAMAVADMVKIDGFLHVQEKLGEAINYLEAAQSCVVRAEVECAADADGVMRPAPLPLQTLRGILPLAYPRIIEILQILGAGGLLMMPSARDYASPIKADVEKYYQGAAGRSGFDRVKLFKLAWDLAGDGFGIRQLQYERYYAGDPVRILANNYLSYEKSSCMRLVDKALALAEDPRRSCQ